MLARFHNMFKVFENVMIHHRLLSLDCLSKLTSDKNHFPLKTNMKTETEYNRKCKILWTKVSDWDKLGAPFIPVGDFTFYSSLLVIDFDWMTMVSMVDGAKWLGMTLRVGTRGSETGSELKDEEWHVTLVPTSFLLPFWNEVNSVWEECVKDESVT